MPDAKLADPRAALIEKALRDALVDAPQLQPDVAGAMSRFSNDGYKVLAAWIEAVLQTEHSTGATVADHFDCEPFEPDHDLVVKVAEYLSQVPRSQADMVAAYGILIHLYDLGIELPTDGNPQEICPECLRPVGHSDFGAPCTPVDCDYRAALIDGGGAGGSMEP